MACMWADQTNSHRRIDAPKLATQIEIPRLLDAKSAFTITGCLTGWIEINFVPFNRVPLVSFEPEVAEVHASFSSYSSKCARKSAFASSSNCCLATKSQLNFTYASHLSIYPNIQFKLASLFAHDFGEQLFASQPASQLVLANFAPPSYLSGTESR